MMSTEANETRYYSKKEVGAIFRELHGERLEALLPGLADYMTEMVTENEWNTCITRRESGRTVLRGGPGSWYSIFDARKSGYLDVAEADHSDLHTAINTKDTGAVLALLNKCPRWRELKSGEAKETNETLLL